MGLFLHEALDQPDIQLVGAWAGRIASTPGDIDVKVYVTISSLGDDFKFGPCRWQSRDDTSLPAVGDRCLVVFDEAQEPYVVLWWPFDS